MTIDIPDTAVYAVVPQIEAQLAKILDGRCPAIKVAGTSMTLAFLVASRIPAEAAEEAKPLISELTDLLGRRPEDAFSIWVAAAERDLPAGGDEGPRDSLPPMVGVGEAAEILGVSKQRVHQLTRAAGFPQPVMRLRATPVWLRSEVLRFQQNRSLRPGPVPATSPPLRAV